MFYLDFLLPAFHDPDGSLPVGIQYGDQTAIIAPWDRASELFEGELGQTIRSAVFLLSPADLPGGQLVRRVADIVIDRLTVAIEWEQEGSPAGDEDLMQLRLEEAVTYANFFIIHLRSVTGSAHLNRIETYWHPDDSTFQVQVPHHVQWVDMGTDTLLPFYRGMNAFSSAGGIRLPFHGTVGWDAMVKSMGTGTLPPFYRTLLADARDALTTADIREAIVSIAPACEIRIEHYIEAQTLISRAAAKRVIKPSPGLSFAERYFDLLPSEVCGQSLSGYDAQVFEDVQDCYSQRNRLMHGGDLLPPLDGMGIAERLRTVSQWLRSAEKAITWVGSLPTVPS